MPMQHEFLDHPIELTCPHCKYEWTYTATAPAFQCPHCRLHGRVDPDSGEITIRARGRPRKRSLPTPAGEASEVPPPAPESLSAEPEIREEPETREEPSPVPSEAATVEPPEPPSATPPPHALLPVRVLTGGPLPTGKAWRLGHGWWAVECPFCQRLLQRRPGTTELRVTCTGCYKEFYKIEWQTTAPPVVGDFIICPNPKCGHSWRRRLATRSPIARCKYCGRTWDTEKVPQPPVHVDVGDLQPDVPVAVPPEHLVATPPSAMDEHPARSDPFASAAAPAPSDAKPSEHHKVMIAGTEVEL